MTTLYMMVGFPASGKSTFIDNMIGKKFMLLSTDQFIENFAYRENKTYDEVFDEAIKPAIKQLNADLKYALENNLNIVWDQTNLTKKSRSSKLASIPKEYTKIVVWVEAEDQETLDFRLANRPGKTIPDFVVKSMKNSFQEPTQDEGFDFVYKVVT